MDGQANEIAKLKEVCQQMATLRGQQHVEHLNAIKEMRASDSENNLTNPTNIHANLPKASANTQRDNRGEMYRRERSTLRRRGYSDADDPSAHANASYQPMEGMLQR